MLIAVLWGMLSLFTGVGGALSDRGREMPVDREIKQAFSKNFISSHTAAQLLSLWTFCK